MATVLALQRLTNHPGFMYPVYLAYSSNKPDAIYPK